LFVTKGLADTTVRFATYNLSLNRNTQGGLISDLSLPANPDAAQVNRIKQAQTVAEIIQRNAPDVLLLNEFDYVGSTQALGLFRNNFLEVGQDTLSTGSPAAPANFTQEFAAPSNTGLASGFDLNNNGVAVTSPGAAGYGDDALGFGAFPGQFGMAFLSKYPIVASEIRTFQNFLWKDMPGALLPDDASTPAPMDFYSTAELGVLPLSSKSHWDIPVNINGDIVHILVRHPTPPVFDGPEDRNGRRNHDEIRFWKDYINGASYIYDDNGNLGGLSPSTRFVIMGDQNSDPLDGDSVVGSADLLLQDPLVNASLTPSSLGAVQAASLQGGINNGHRNPSMFDTADFADTAPGNLRADYVLPSAAGLDPLGGGVFWPENSDTYFPLVGTFSFNNYFAGLPSSDHKLVFTDLSVNAVPEPSTCIVGAFMAAAAGMVLRRRINRA